MPANDARIFHVSTDYVLTAPVHIPYREDDPVSPVSVYGKSKLEGEKAVLMQYEYGTVVRTSWLYSLMEVISLIPFLRLSRKGRLKRGL
jgi:dTDP-4-dehydrorhamnose reductase